MRTPNDFWHWKGVPWRLAKYTETRNQYIDCMRLYCELDLMEEITSDEISNDGYDCVYISRIICTYIIRISLVINEDAKFDFINNQIAKVLNNNSNNILISFKTYGNLPKTINSKIHFTSYSYSSN